MPKPDAPNVRYGWKAGISRLASYKRPMTQGSLSVLLRDAIDASDLGAIRTLLERHPEEKQAHGFLMGGTCLHYAASYAGLQVVELLVDVLGVDIDALDLRGEQSPLAAAAGLGRVEIVQFLLGRGAAAHTAASISNPMIACISGYRGQRDEPRERFAEIAQLLIDHGMDLTACYNQQSMVDMDVSAFAYMFGRRDIAAMVISALYGHDERLAASAWAEAIEVALGNAWSRQKFRKARYPSKRASAAESSRVPGDYWV